MQELDTMPHRPEIRFTPTEKRILALLSDGEAHLAKDMVSCLEDELGERETITRHIASIRNKLPQDQWIVCEVRHRKAYYRHVIILKSRVNGKPSA
jgi:hypothetical protein